MILCWFALISTSFAQGLNYPDGDFEVNHLPWNGWYYPTTKNQMVMGEEYRDYPGPLPKFLYALGLGTNHPSIDWELLHNVDRDAPDWFGMCNGWAVSAVEYDEPQTLVVNGVKLFPGDLKAILAAIYKNNSIITFGSLSGTTPRDFERMLYEVVAADSRAVVVDVDISEEVWNYPVAGFERYSTNDGEWTNVELVVTYAQLLVMDSTDVTDSFVPNRITYNYRINNEFPETYQWLGEPDARPRVAWVTRKPYSQGVWFAEANHYFSPTTYEDLLAMADDPNAILDLQEPNNSVDAAFPLAHDVVLSSLHDGDVDYYRTYLEAGERLLIDIEVYDGADIKLRVLNQDEEAVLEETDIRQYTLETAVPSSGWYYIEVERNTNELRDSFYKINFPYEYSAFDKQAMVGTFAETQLRAINAGTDSLRISGNDDISVDGSAVLELETNHDIIRSNMKTVWAEETDGPLGKSKRYHLDHIRQMPYVVPHLTCKNGWKTLLEIARSDLSIPVVANVYDAAGALLQTVDIPFEGAFFTGDFSKLLSEQAGANGAWFELQTGVNNNLSGQAVFLNGLGDPIKIDVVSRPRHGLLKVFDLKDLGEGGTGIALLNTSDFESEILYRLRDGDNNALTNGQFMLQPGEKFVSTVRSLVGQDVESDYVLELHSQYAVDSLVIQYQIAPKRLYGHRMFGEFLDEITESYISMPVNEADLEQVSFLFTNPGSRSTQLIFEGFDASGQLQGRFQMVLGQALRPREYAFASLAQILDNGLATPDGGNFEAITHFKVRTQYPVFGMEFVGSLEDATLAGVPLLRVYEMP
jgi:hypothetical protein